jgi:hypothetical protein
MGCDNAGPCGDGFLRLLSGVERKTEIPHGESVRQRPKPHRIRDVHVVAEAKTYKDFPVVADTPKVALRTDRGGGPFGLSPTLLQSFLLLTSGHLRGRCLNL